MKICSMLLPVFHLNIQGMSHMLAYIAFDENHINKSLMLHATVRM